MTNLIPVPAQHRFDEAALAAFLASAVPDFRAPLTVQQFRGGQSNPTFLLEWAGRRAVLRKKPPGALLPSAHAVEREYRVMRALWNTAVPVPEMLAFSDDPAIIGTPFFVMDFVPGRIFEDVTLSAVPVAERGAMYDAMADTLAALHRVDYATAGLADFGKSGGYVERQVHRWSKQFKATETEPLPAMERLISWLPHNLPAADETSLTHGDYRLGNIMFHPTEPRVVALLDWELSTLGHPLADLAFNALAWHIPAAGETDVLPGLAGLDQAGHGLPAEQDYLQRYVTAAGRAGVPRDWPFWIAFAAFRFAAICQGVYYRGLQGNAADSAAPKYGAAARVFAEIGEAQIAG